MKSLCRIFVLVLYTAGMASICSCAKHSYPVTKTAGKAHRAQQDKIQSQFPK